MKTYLSIFVIVLNCSISFSQNYVWTQKADYVAGGVYDPFNFVIGNKAYVGGGASLPGVYRFDFWEYDPANDVWTQKANFPGAGRYGGKGFAIGNFGFAGSGWGTIPYNDFYKYDPLTNNWTAIANFIGTARYTASSFSLGNKGYFGLGYAPCKKDIWMYDPSLDLWTQLADFPGAPRQDATAFVTNGFGFLGMGTCNTNIQTDMYKYDHQFNSWTQVASFPGDERSSTMSFSIGDTAYVGFGNNYLNNNQPFDVFTDFWQYDALNDNWLQLPDFPGGKRYHGIGFAIGNKGYIGLGSDTLFNIHYLDDLWEYAPDATGIHETVVKAVNIYPNPVSDHFNIEIEEMNMLFTIHDMNGKIVMDRKLPKGSHDIQTGNLAKGNYQCMVWDNGRLSRKGSFVKL